MVEHAPAPTVKACQEDQTKRLIRADVVMPKRRGQDWYENIREIRPDLKVLYMSGYTEATIAHRGVLEEGTEFIQKPFSIEELARKVREVLDD